MGPLLRHAATFLAGTAAGVGALRLLLGVAPQRTWLRGWGGPAWRPRHLAVAAPAQGSFEQQVTFVYVRDLGRSAKFYQSVLGLRPVLDQTPPGEASAVVRIYEVTPTSYLGLCERDPKSLDGTAVAADGVILCLVTDEVQEWGERLLAAGITLEKPPTLNERYNIFHLFLRDPDGHLVEIQQFRDPAWPRRVTQGSGLLTVAKGRAPGHDCGCWPLWSCPALPDPAGRFQESLWWEGRPGAAEERCLVLEGRAVLTDAQDHRTLIEAGDWVIFRKGFTCLWEVEEAISKRYQYFTADGSVWNGHPSLAPSAKDV